MKKNKIISFVLAIVMVFSVAATAIISASAADMALTVSKSSESGGVLKVAVSISNNKGFKGMGVIVNYDSSVLTPTSFSYGGALSGTMSVLDNIGSNAGSISFIISEKSTGNGSSSNGALVIISFKEKSSVKKGTKTSVSASCNANSTYDLNQEYTLNVGSGSASISLSGTSTAKQTTTKKVTTTKKKTTTTKKAVASTKKTTLKVNGAVTATTVPETTEETAVESATVSENISEETTTEYQTEKTMADAKQEKGSNKALFRGIAIAVIVVCAGAAAVIYVRVKKDDGDNDTTSGNAE